MNFTESINTVSIDIFTMGYVDDCRKKIMKVSVLQMFETRLHKVLENVLWEIAYSGKKSYLAIFICLLFCGEYLSLIRESQPRSETAVRSPKKTTVFNFSSAY